MRESDAMPKIAALFLVFLCVMAAYLLLGPDRQSEDTVADNMRSPVERSGGAPDIPPAETAAAEDQGPVVPGQAPRTDAVYQLDLSDEELIDKGINPSMQDWAVRFLMDPTDDAFAERFMLLRTAAKISNDCYDVTLPDGQSSKWCGDEPPDDYFLFDTAGLEQLAVVDATAAQVLGYRLRMDDPARAEHYFLRAAALSQKPGPVIDYLNLRLDLMMDPATGRLLNEDKALHGLALAHLVDRIGYPFFYAPAYERLLVESGATPEALAAARESANQLFEELERTRQNAIGGDP